MHARVVPRLQIGGACVFGAIRGNVFIALRLSLVDTLGKRPNFSALNVMAIRAFPRVFDTVSFVSGPWRYIAHRVDCLWLASWWSRCA